ncbi:MAG: hypothetical protein DMD91_16010 [Candidatus Rokuibacteriota bacterium]|nr:MAG: hypothetical protein DMD91_16010 [Candidatus Rokubacteria bacterium]
MQDSVGSQEFAAARQSVVGDANPSLGQLALVPVQLSCTSQTPLAARQMVVAVAKPLAGQVALVPVQLSCTSQTPLAARQMVVAAVKPSAGQVALVPVQLSCTSQTPLAARQMVVAVAKPSAGQVALVPVQLSCTSQTPLAARQMVVADAKPSAGQLALVPVQLSCTSQTPLEARQMVVAVAKPSAGHAVLVPVQLSCTSQTPLAARQMVVAVAKPLAGQSLLVPVQLSATSQTPADARQIVVTVLNVGSHNPVSVLQTLDCSQTRGAGQVGHRVRVPVLAPAADSVGVVLHVASPVLDVVCTRPAIWMMASGSKLLFAWFFTVVSKVRVQKFRFWAGMARAGLGVKTSWFGEVPPAGLLLVHVMPAHVVVMVASPPYESGGPPAPAPGSASAPAQLIRLPPCLQAMSSRTAVMVSVVPPLIVPAPRVNSIRTVLLMSGKFGVGET